MVQLDEGKDDQIDTSNQDAPVDIDEETTEASDIYTKEYENTRTRAIMENSRKVVERLDMKFGGKKYVPQFIDTE